MKTHKILMVCLGNICRSPVAEEIMRAKATHHNIPLQVDSAGTGGYHIGEAPDARSIRNAKKNGLDISNLRARKISVHDFEHFDWIYTMDESNYQDVCALAPSSQNKAKVKLILSEVKNNTIQSVPDPYFGGEQGFQIVFDLLNEACEAIIIKIKQQKEEI